MSKLKFITTFEELRTLPSGQRINQISRGIINTYTVVGSLGETSGLVMTRGNSNTGLFYVNESDFKKNEWTIEYDKKLVGKLMIRQIKEYADSEIKNITAVYLKED